MHTDKDKETEINEINDAAYWREMYDELEEQMHQMMEMTLDLIDKEAGKGSTSSQRAKSDMLVPDNFEKEFRRLQLFEHRIKVTLLGKITLKYIGFKRRLKKLIKGK